MVNPGCAEVLGTLRRGARVKEGVIGQMRPIKFFIYVLCYRAEIFNSGSALALYYSTSLKCIIREVKILYNMQGNI